MTSDSNFGEKALWRLYWSEGLSLTEVAERWPRTMTLHPESEVTAHDVLIMLRMWGIPRRHGDETQRPSRRISLNEVYMRLAETIALRSHNPRHAVGAVVVSGDLRRVLSVGYNGNARGLANFPDNPEAGLSGTVHAEANALITAGEHGTDRQMFTTLSPCMDCAKLIINAGIKRLWYRELYRDERPLDLLRWSQVVVQQLPEEDT